MFVRLPAERLAQVGRERGLERPAEGALGDGDVEAGAGRADVGATAGRPAGRVETTSPAGVRTIRDELTLRTDRPTGDAGPIRGAPRRRRPSPPGLRRHLPGGTTVAAFFVARFGLAATAGFGGRRCLGGGSDPRPRSAAVAFFVARFGLAACGSASARRDRVGRRPVGLSGAGGRIGRGLLRRRASASRRGLGRLGRGAASASSVAVAVGRCDRCVAASAAAFASATETSLRMSIRQPVSRAASRAFWPSRPIASDSIRSGTVTLAMRCSSSMSTEMTWAGLRALATNTARRRRSTG